MEWYRYDENTGEYLCPVRCQRDPLPPHGFLPLEQATPEPPLPIKDGFVSVYQKGTWTYKEDHRGKTAYSVLDKSELKIETLEDIPSTHTLLKPEEFDQWNGNHWKTDHKLRFQTLCQRYCDQIDSLASFVRRRFISGDVDVIAEYQRAEQAARQFKNNNYTGTVPAPIQTAVEAYNVSNQEATDSILYMADTMNEALDTIRDYRLKAKAELKAQPESSTDEAFKTVYDEWAAKLDQVKPTS